MKAGLISTKSSVSDMHLRFAWDIYAQLQKRDIPCNLVTWVESFKSIPLNSWYRVGYNKINHHILSYICYCLYLSQSKPKVKCYPSKPKKQRKRRVRKSFSNLSIYSLFLAIKILSIKMSTLYAVCGMLYASLIICLL